MQQLIEATQRGDCITLEEEKEKYQKCLDHVSGKDRSSSVTAFDVKFL